MSQFSEIMDMLEQINLKLDFLGQRVKVLDAPSLQAGLESEDLELEDDSNGEQIIHIEDPGVPRRRVPYKTKDGEDRLYDSNLLERKVKEVMAIAIRRNDPWQLYENPDGTMRIMVSGETVAEWDAQHPGSGVGERG